MKNNKQDLYIFIIMIALIGLTIGYAALSSTLNINGKSSISKNTWDVYFDNVVVKGGSVEEVKIPTITDKTTVDFEVALNLPGDFYEFTVDVVNNGSIDAMIESIEKTPILTEAQAKYLSYTINYENGEQIATKQLVKKKESVRLKVKVELRTDIAPSDLPEIGDVLYLSFTTNYVQADESGVNVNNNGIKVKPVASGDINEIGTIVTIGTEQFYTIGTEGDNVKLLSMYNLYVGNVVNQGQTASPIENPTGMQDSTAKGYIEKNGERDYPFIGTTAFSDISCEYSGSIVEGYVNNYKYLLESNFEIEVIEARLITSDELTSQEIGCDYECFRSPYPWIYSTSYWSAEVFDDFAYSVESVGRYSFGNYSSNWYSGVRPVILISKDYFE